MNAWLDACQNVYKHLQDEMSRTIFLHRMNYSMTGNDAHLADMIRMLPEGAQVYKIPKQPAYIFGAGSYGKKTKRFLPMEWIGFIDNDNQKRGGVLRRSARARAGRCPA